MVDVTKTEETTVVTSGSPTPPLPKPPPDDEHVATKAAKSVGTWTKAIVGVVSVLTIIVGAILWVYTAADNAKTALSTAKQAKAKVDLLSPKITALEAKSEDIDESIGEVKDLTSTLTEVLLLRKAVAPPEKTP